MKKMLCLILAVMMIFIARMSFADASYPRGMDARIKTEPLSGTAAATLSSNVTTNNRVIGYTFSDSSAGNTALFDASEATGSASSTNDPDTTNVFGEADVIAGGNVTVVFPFPRALTKGLVMKNSATTGKLVVYYE